MDRSFILVRTLLVFGLAVWLTLILINNLTDPGTNVYLIGQMISMTALKLDGVMGRGLLWRALESPALAKILLNGVVIVQFFTVLLLWRAAIHWVRVLRARPARAIAATNQALAAFLGLWFLFLCGGLWFGYWMKMGPVQQVHMTLVIISLLSLIAVNMQPANR